MYRAYSTSDIESPKAWKADILKPVQVPSSAPSIISAVTNETLGVSHVLLLILFFFFLLPAPHVIVFPIDTVPTSMCRDASAETPL